MHYCLDNTAVEGEALIQFFGPDDSDIPLRSENAEERALHNTTGSHRPFSEEVSFEISGKEVQRKNIDEGHVFGQEVFIESIVNYVVENGSYLFRVRKYGYSFE